MTTPTTPSGLELAQQMDRLLDRDPRSGATALVEEILTDDSLQASAPNKEIPINQKNSI